MAKKSKVKKHYTVEQVVAMFPYLRSYIDDITKCFQEIVTLKHRDEILKSIVTNDKNKTKRINLLLEHILLRMESLILKYWRWRDELSALNIRVCSAKCGFLDVPTWDKSTNGIIFLCIGKESNAKNLQWHSSLKENYRNSRPYWVVPKKVSS